MSDDTIPAKPGPGISEGLTEIRGLFPSNATLEDAISRLTREGFDRADLSIPDPAPTAASATPEAGAANPSTETDDRQTQTLHSSMAASVGALAAAGAVIASGGLAAPAVAAAVAGGVGLGAAAEGVARAANQGDDNAREEAAKRGELFLSVALRRPDQQAKAEAAMWKAGAMRVTPVTRTSTGGSSPQA
ncbi:MAG: hypothetical protein JOZ42_04075 [Acetobacteraceae bacterium]|nr:hypothetical protein [Acetobacteraceae bacterium]